MENLARRGRRVYYFNVVAETGRVVQQDTGGALPHSMFLEAVESLVTEGTIDCGSRPQADWRIVDHGGRDFDVLAKQAVLETMNTLDEDRIPANRHTVPEEAAQLLYRRGAARIDIGAAHEFVTNAIQALEMAGRIECPDSPREWQIVR